MRSSAFAVVRTAVFWYNRLILNKIGAHLQGRIIKSLAGFYYVEADGQVYQTRARGNFRKKGQTPYVGDWVEFSAK